MLKKPWMLGLGLPADDCITLTDEDGECLAREQCQHAGGQPAGACHQGDKLTTSSLFMLLFNVF